MQADNAAGNEAVARRAFELVQDDDLDAVFDQGLAAAGIEFRPAFAFPGPDRFSGREGVEEFLERWTEGFEDWTIYLDRVLSAGDKVLLIAHQSTTGRGSGASGDQDFALVFTFADGAISRAELHLDNDKAADAAGVALEAG